MTTRKSTPAVPRFVRWIDEVSPPVLAKQLGVHVRSIYGWRKNALGEKGGYRPDPKHMPAIIRLSKGAIKAVDIYPEAPKA